MVGEQVALFARNYGQHLTLSFLLPCILQGHVGGDFPRSCPQAAVTGLSPERKVLEGRPLTMSTFRQEDVEDHYEMGEELGR